MKKKKWFLVYILTSVLASMVCFSMTSCSNKGELSRSKAKKLIAEELTKDIVTTNVNLGRQSYNVNQSANKQQYEDIVDKGYRDAVTKGLITMTLIEKFRRFLWWDVYEIKLTDKAKPFVQEEKQTWAKVKLADKVVEEVTGITVPSDAMGQKMCQASFTYKLKPTPFGECFIPEKELNEIKKSEAVFILYDDGWRLAR